LLDVLLYILQVTSLIVSYLDSHTTIPSSAEFAYTDLLLPPSPLDTALYDVEDEVDLEGGMRRRKGTSPGLLEHEDGEETIWLNEEDELLRPAPFRSDCMFFFLLSK
jgi:hypothetical protein